MRAGGSRNAASRNTCTRRFSARIEANILPMTIRKVTEHKKRFLDLLLLADEQESLIDRYLERGVLYVLEDGGVKAECVVTDEGNGVLEIKGIVCRFAREAVAKRLFF